MLVEKLNIRFLLCSQLHADILDLLAHLHLVGASCHTDIHYAKCVIPPFADEIVSIDEEGQWRIVIVYTCGGETDILTNTNHRIVFGEQFLIHLHPVPFLTGSLIDDIAVTIMLVEVTSLYHFNTHRSEVVIIDRQHGGLYLVVFVVTSPYHVLVTVSQCEL